MYSATFPQHRESIQQDGPSMMNPRMFKMYGAILAIMAAATLSLGTANVVLTSEAYCAPWMDEDPVYCSNTGEPYVWTWVAPGVWASLPIFLAGLYAMMLGNDPSRFARIFALLIYLSAIVFAPAMLILSSIEVWRGHASTWNFYKLNDELKEGNIWVEESPYQAKFALPLVITILAGIMFLMTGLITLVLCCCMQSIGMSMSMNNDGPIAPMVKPIYQPPAQPTCASSGEVYCPPRGQLRSTVDYQPTTGPYMATRYNGCDQNNQGVMFGNFPSRSFTPTPPVNNFFDSNAAYRFR